MIKVERPGAGDDTRHWGPPFVLGADGGIWARPIITAPIAASAASRSMLTAAGRAEVRALIADADVVIENYKVGGLAKPVNRIATLCADHPRLIVCSITGFDTRRVICAPRGL